MSRPLKRRDQKAASH